MCSFSRTAQGGVSANKKGRRDVHTFHKGIRCAQESRFQCEKHQYSTQATWANAYASTLVSLLEFAKTDDNFTVIAFASDQWAQEWTSMAFTKEDDDLRGAFDDAIRSMKSDGALAKLQEKWFGKSFVDTLPDASPTW